MSLAEVELTSLRDQEAATASKPPKNTWRITAICFWTLLIGSNDATAGALLPSIQTYYGLTYTLVSLIWLGNALGFIIVACLSHKLTAVLSTKNTFIFGCSCCILSFALISSGTVFPVIVIAFLFTGIGASTCLSVGNIYLANFGTNKYLSIAQSMYGFGATIAPIIGTSMVSAGVRWHFFYLILLGLMAVSLVGYQLSFGQGGAIQGDAQGDARGARDDAGSAWGDGGSENGAAQNGATHGASQGGARDGAGGAGGAQGDGAEGTLQAALGNKFTWVIALFVFFYQGAEVSIGGWVVTYLLDYRHGTSAVGYVASGFWGGVALGRLTLVRPLHKWLGGRRSVTVCSLLSIVLAVITWLIPNVIAAAVFVSILGFFVGPNYPIMIKVVTELLPRKIQTVSLTIVTAFGSAGGAFFPFLVGLLSQTAGAYVAFPAFIGLYSAMVCLWLYLPNRDHPATTPTVWQRLW